MRRSVRSALMALATVASLAATTAVGPQMPATAGPTQADAPIVLVFDLSGSMNEADNAGTIKVEGAKKALLDLIDGLSPATPIKLRTYPTVGTDCDVQLRDGSQVAPVDKTGLSATIRALTAGGGTPTALALAAAANDMADYGGTNGSIILVSDGQSNCGQSPCDQAKSIKSSGIGITVNTLGFNISAQGKAELECIASATNGTYHDVADVGQLQTELKRSAAAKLKLTVEAPQAAAAAVGSGDGDVTIKALVSNTGERPLEEVRAQLEFDLENSPGIVRPVQHLGVLENGGQRTVTWTFRPPLSLTSKTLTYRVIASGNDVNPETEERSITFSSGASLADVGTIFKGLKHVVIMGDSYSSGEGTGSYMPGTDAKNQNTCHRSADSYAMHLFEPAPTIVACSGAVIAGIDGPEEANRESDGKLVASQLDQLRALPDTDAILMTLGGNDAEFGDIIMNCLFDPGPCDQDERGGMPYPDYVKTVLLPGILFSLPLAYRQVSAVVNDAQRLNERGGKLAPIVVLAYPRISAYESSVRPNCVNQMTAGEETFVSEFVAGLNATVQASVAEAKAHGVPIEFVPQIADAFLPNHTVCDNDPYAYGQLDAINLMAAAGEIEVNFGTKVLNWISPWKDLHPPGVLQQMYHPNAKGYLAETRALVKWSVGPEANALAGRLTARIDNGRGSAVQFATAPHLGGSLPLDTARASALATNTNYEASADGFAPRSHVSVAIASVRQVLATTWTDDNGRALAHITIPIALEPGQHTITASGRDANGAVHEVSLVVRVRRPQPAHQRVVMAASAAAVLAAAACALNAWRLRRRFTRTLSPLPI
jgi:von Willebrand factor type A domain/GDSL-like Lipase/Acylhydrolase family